MSLHDTTNPESDEEYSPEQLLRMDADEADMWLTDEQLERRAKLLELYDGAEETRKEWEAEERVAVDTLIQADMGELTEEFEIYGNDIEVLLNMDHEQIRLVREIESKYENVEDIDELTDEQVDRLESMIAEFYELMFYRFNGRKLESYGVTPFELTKRIVEEWGIRASIYAMIDIIERIDEKDTETMNRVKNLQGGEGRT